MSTAPKEWNDSAGSGNGGITGGPVSGAAAVVLSGGGSIAGDCARDDSEGIGRPLEVVQADYVRVGGERVQKHGLVKPDSTKGSQLKRKIQTAFTLLPSKYHQQPTLIQSSGRAAHVPGSES